MDNNNLQPPQSGRGGRPLHIAHRRSPSEMTPLMSKYHLSYMNARGLIFESVEQLAIQQQIDLLQQQQNQILAASQQFANMGMMQQQQIPGPADGNADEPVYALSPPQPVCAPRNGHGWSTPRSFLWRLGFRLLRLRSAVTRERQSSWWSRERPTR
ncbi:hypothetical protein FH972_021766 [Carpinus fangiana]|uniref:Uncharacterized protein n=1 Tax=Carpinus fangiana TaxID=176857 RepID=A0A5N6KQ91_9ROSI|nr:hypothetical protein FH972_021766 [Carpinus fangiana]